MRRIWPFQAVALAAGVMAIAGMLASPASAIPAAKAGNMAAQAAVNRAHTAVAFPPNANYCKVGGTAPCVAGTQDPPVYFYPHSGGSENVGIVEITISCYYFGTPVVNGDNVEDHAVFMIQNGAGFVVNGHVPDAKVDLGGHNPWDDGIPEC